MFSGKRISLFQSRASSRTETYPNYSGALATAGNLVFLGHYDGAFSAYDVKMQTVDRFGGISASAAPPPLPGDPAEAQSRSTPFIRSGDPDAPCSPPRSASQVRRLALIN